MRWAVQTTRGRGKVVIEYASLAVSARCWRSLGLAADQTVRGNSSNDLAMRGLTPKDYASRPNQRSSSCARIVLATSFSMLGLMPGQSPVGLTARFFNQRI